MNRERQQRSVVMALAPALLLAVLVAASLPPRAAILVAPAVAAAALMAPGMLRARSARRQRDRLVAGLPDMLDLLATGAESGRSLDAVIRDVSFASDSPLAREMAATAASIEAGTAPDDAWGELRDTLGGEAGAFVVAIGRSRRHGAPLARHLRTHAAEIRRRHAIDVADRAAKAAPKIQLVVAMVLVPSVMLGLAAAIVANLNSFWPL